MKGHPNKNTEKENSTPPVGLEPTATRLRVLRSTIWAMEAWDKNFCQTQQKYFHKNKRYTSGGIRTRNPRIRSPMRYPLRHGGKSILVGLEPTTARSEV